MYSLALIALLLPRLAHATPLSPPSSTPPGAMAGVTLVNEDGGIASVVAGKTSPTTFTLTNLGTLSVNVNLVATVCNGALVTCTPSPATTTLVGEDVRSVTVTVKGGNLTGTGTLTLVAKNASTGQQLAAASVTVTVTSSLTVSTAPHAGSLIDVSGCVADCFETVYDYTTPAYISRDVPRSVTLQYRSGRARPYGRLSLDAIEANAAITTMRLRLQYPNGSYVTFLNGSTSLYFARNTTGPTRLMAEFDAASVATSANQYTAEVTTFIAAGTQAIVNTTPVRIIVLNDTLSPFGAGVDLVGIHRAVPQADGVLITDGSGSASFFAGTCAVGQNNCVFTSPSGDFSTLTSLNGQYLRKYPDGSVVQIDQITGLTTAIIDRFGTATTIAATWNVDYQKYVPLTITDPEGQVTTFYYRPPSNLGGFKQGSLGYISPRSNRQVYFGVSTAGDLSVLVDADWVSKTYLGYDGLHRLTSKQNQAGSIWNYTYRYGKTIDYVDAPTIAVDGGGNVRPRTTYREYLSDLYTTAIAGGGTSQATAIAKGSALAQVIDPGNHTTQFTLDRWNQSLTITDALNRTTTINRDTIGRPLQIVSFTGATDSLKYNGRDLVTMRPAGRDSTNYRWSTKSLTTIPGTSISITYTVLDSVWGPRQPWQQYIYAANGAIQTVKSRYVQGDPTVFKTGFATDTYGRVVADTDNAGHVTKTFYNGRYGNADSTAAHGNQWTKKVFDAEGRDSLSWMSDRPRPLIALPTGPIKDRTLYDVMNRVVNMNDGLHPDVTFEYDTLFLRKVRDRSGQVFRFDHNALGWVTRRYDPADTVNWSRFVQYSYDVDGELKTLTNRRGQAITTTYDVLHRRTSVSSVSGTDNFGYSADGLRSAAWNAVSTDSSFFRANGWQDSVVTRIAGRRFRTTYLPDAYLRLDSIDISMGGSPITFPGRKYIYHSVQNVLQTIRIAGYFGATLNRNTEGMVNSITYPLANSNSRTRTLDFTSTHQVFKDFIPSLWQPVLAYNTAYYGAYGYDSLGRIKEETLNPDFATRVSTFTYAQSRLDSHNRFETTPSVCPAASPDYGYNCASLASGSNPYNSASYQYDNADNRLSDWRLGKDASGTTFNVSTYYGFDAGDRVRTATGGGKYGPGDDIAPFAGTALTFERDLDGNLTRRYGATTDVRYGWDAIGHLTSVTVPATGATVNYDYNASGQLVRRRTNGTVDRHFLWDGDNLFAELDGTAGSRIAEYVHWGLDQPLAVLSGPFTYNELDYVVQDGRGNVRLLFGQTPDARINFQTDYSDWGTPVNTTWGALANRLLFKGMFYEGDSTKLYYARNRWYSPEFGGFMSEDPLSIGGGLNTYAFGDGDPINGSDSYGLFPGFTGGGVTGTSDFWILGAKVVASFFRHGFGKPPARPHRGATPVPVAHSDPFSQRVWFIGGTASGFIGAGGEGGAGIILWSPDGPGVYGRVGGGPGAEVGAGGELGSSTNLKAFRGVSDGWGATILGAGGGYSANKDGGTWTVTGGPKINPEVQLFLVTAHVERSNTWAYTWGDLVTDVEGTYGRAQGEMHEFERQAYDAMTRGGRMF